MEGGDDAATSGGGKTEGRGGRTKWMGRQGVKTKLGGVMEVGAAPGVCGRGHIDKQF